MIFKDFAVHSGFEEHAVYQLGRRFLVEEESGKVNAVTCMGSARYSFKDKHSHRTDLIW